MVTSNACAVVLAMAIGSSGWAMESTDTSDDRDGRRVELLSTWWAPDEGAGLLFTWSRPSQGGLSWWHAADSSPLLFAFSSPEENGELAFAWSRPDESRQLVFTWSQSLEPAAEGSASGEPDGQ